MSKTPKAGRQRGPTLFKPTVKATHRQRTFNIEDLADDGRGIARDEGKAVFVDGALPGEKVTAMVNSSRARFDEATVISRELNSADRVEPLCEYYEACGGCQLQHLNYDAQQRWRVKQLERRLEQSALPTISGEPYGYRHRLRLSASNGFIGLLAPRSKRVVEIDKCVVADAQINSALPKILAWAKLAMSRLGLTELIIASGQERLGLALICDKQVHQKVLHEYAAKTPMGVDVYVVKNTEGVVLWENDLPPLLLTGGLQFLPGDFTQANPVVNRQLKTAAVEALDVSSSDKVADLFCGLGNFSAPIAVLGATVTGFELDKDLLIRAQLQHSHLETLNFHYADLFSPRNNLLNGFNKVLLDPPRAGAAAMCELILKSNVERIVYVSCDMATLERDIATLAPAFAVRETRVADMFPQTRHTETLTLLERQ